MTRNLHTRITSLLYSATLHVPTACASPARWGGLGRGLSHSLFLNTEDTDLTEYHPAHFDRTDAASRQLMTRNLRTRITSLLYSATLHVPTAPASPAPWGGLGRGFPPRQPHPPLGEGWGGASSLGEGWGGASSYPPSPPVHIAAVAASSHARSGSSRWGDNAA